MKKIISILSLVSVIIPSFLLGVKPAVSDNKTYNSADVIEINKQVIAVAPNGSGVETLLITRDNEIRKLAEAVPAGAGIKPQGVYTRMEQGQAIAYVAAGAAIQKYNISSPTWPALVKSVDSAVGYAHDITGRDNTSLILVAGDQGVKEMETRELAPIREIWKGESYGIDINANGKIVLNTYNKALTLHRNGAAEFVANLKHNQPALTKPYITSGGAGFAAGDQGVKKIGANVEFASPSGFGYSVDALEQDDYIYFVNGWGVYKLDKNLNEIEFQTINLIDGWARGIKVFKAYGKTKILVLASDRIYLLNDSLEILDIYTYQPMRNLKTISIDDDPAQLKMAAKASPSDQPLAVRVSKAPVMPGERIKVYVTGFYPGEPLILEVGSLTERTVADGNGNVVFEHIVIPEQKSYPVMINVRVFGQNSKLNYSTAVRVEEPEPEIAPEPEIVDLQAHTENIIEAETTREVTEEEQDGKTIIHEIINTIERIVQRQIAEMEIRDGAIEVQRGSVALNTYVRWINKDKKEHSVSSIETPDKNETFETGKLKQDQSYQFKFEIVGTYQYIIDGKKDIIYEIIVVE